MWRPHVYLFIINFIAISLVPANSADKYTDENRPYEFGFNIEGEQHRHEKKDENGIIMGEFGFITADGVYHVTVYATDKNGNFKILSMKNIRVRPYPTAKTVERQGHSLKLPASPESPKIPEVTSQAPTTTAILKTQKPISLEPPRACSSCSLPTTSTLPPPEQKLVEQNYGNVIPQTPQRRPVQIAGLSPVANDYQQSAGPNQLQSPALNPQLGSRSNIPNVNSQNNYLYDNQQPGLVQDTYPQQPEQAYKPNYPANNPKSDAHQSAYNPEEPNAIPNSQRQGQRESKQYDFNNNNIDNPLQPNYDNNRVPEKPVLISAQMQIVNKNTDIYINKPGEVDGLPKGLNADDMTTLLYTFNYTVGFHGHHEEGYRNGAKKGYYFITGRNGIRTRVDYEADEKGFRPRISQEVLDILSDEVPKPETEKDDKYGLKGYEFKWLYFPTGSRRK